MLIVLLLWSIEDVIIKFTLDFEEVIVVYFWVRLSSHASVFIFNHFLSLSVQDYKDIIRQEKKMMKFVGLSAFIKSISLILIIYTYSLVELSIAAPITGSYPLFVLLWVFIFSKLGFKLKSYKNFKYRIVSVIIFLTGVVIIV